MKCKSLGLFFLNLLISTTHLLAAEANVLAGTPVVDFSRIPTVSNTLSNQFQISIIFKIPMN